MERFSVHINRNFRLINHFLIHSVHVNTQNDSFVKWFQRLCLTLISVLMFRGTNSSSGLTNSLGVVWCQIMSDHVRLEMMDWSLSWDACFWLRHHTHSSSSAVRVSQQAALLINTTLLIRSQPPPQTRLFWSILIFYCGETSNK